MNQELFNSIKESIQQNGWKRLLLAVSGGLDSICLSHYFICNKSQLGIKWLGIVHVHHGLRNGSADRDANFVQNFADKLNTPFYLKRLDGAALKTMPGSLEENARNARYQALKEVVADLGFSIQSIENTDKVKTLKIAVATAHHAGDQAETVYLRLRRGVTLAGLRGIQPLANSFGFPVIRPFLNVSRQELLEYAQNNNLAWCEDESNTDTKFARNQVRHRSLPHLENLFPGAINQLLRIANLTKPAYEKALAKADTLFAPAIIPKEQWPFNEAIAPYSKILPMDAVFVTAHLQQKGMGELFRLWLDHKGFRFPLDFFQSPKTFVFPTKKNHHKHFIEKCRHIVWFYQSDSQAPSINFYLGNDKKRFSHERGLWRTPQEGDILWPLDEKIKARPLTQWFKEKGIPSFIHKNLDVLAQGSRVLFVSGLKLENKKGIE